MEGALGTGQREREIVRKTAELLSLGAPLSDLFERFCMLLAEFVDASVVFIALESDEGAYIEFAYDHGVSLRDAHVAVSPASQTARVMKSGESLFMSGAGELPADRVPLNIPGAAIDDTASAIFVPLRFGASVIGVLSVQTGREGAYDHGALQLLETCALYVAVAVQADSMRSQKERAEAVATTDAVTRTATRRVFDERIAYEWARANRSGSALAVIIMDIDLFKSFNDTYGHVAGDVCLAQVAQAARSCVSRSTDLFARYGGEEFAAIVCEVTPTGALGIAERMRAAVAALQIPHKHAPLGYVSASFGVACLSANGEDARPLLRSADRALYAAKAAGRNRVVLDARLDIEDPETKALGNLPAPATAFIGRALELDALSRSLAVSRLTTIVGPAGVGKTRCAQAVGRQMQPAYAYGVWFVDLSAVRDAGELAPALCAAFRLAQFAQRRPFDTIVEFLAEKHCLIILDNCEQIASAVSDLCEEIVSRSARTTIVATSREPLKSAHERVFTLEPLTREDASALFCDRAAAAFPGIVFDAQDVSRIGELCERLDDLPLAIELAAPRVKTMSTAQLLVALQERFEVLVSSRRGIAARQRTLEAAIEWSYQLLENRAKMLFERLSVFAGAFDADAVRDVCGFAPLRPGEAAAALDEVLEKNLITPAGGAEDRFTLLESMREFAASRLRNRGEEALAQSKHVAYYLALALRIGEQMKERPTQAFSAAAREWPEFRATLERSIAREIDPKAGEELVLALCPYWSDSGRTHEAATWIARALAAVPAESPRRGDLVYAAALAAHSAGDFLGLRGYAYELLSIAQRPHSTVSLGAAYNALGNAEFHLGHAAQAEHYYRMALERHRALGERRGVAIVLMNLGAFEADLNLDFAGARDRFLEALNLFRDLGLSVNAGIVLANLGEVTGQMGDYPAALAYAKESLSTFERLSNKAAVAWQYVNIAHYRLEMGDHDASRSALRSAYALLSEHPQREYLAGFFEVAMYLGVETQRFALAGRTAGYLESYREREAVPRLPSAQRHWSARLERLRDRLGAPQFEALFASGRFAAPEELTAELLR